MAIQKVLKMGHAQLAQPSQAIVDFSKTMLSALRQDMYDTMIEKGGVGIAAPQIGRFVRVILFGFEKNERYPDEKPVPLTFLINPSIEILSEEKISGWEGCLSVPGLRGLVPRYNKIQYTGYDLEGHFISRSVEGFHARVVQHECDHIDGVLYPRRIEDLTEFGFEDELKERIWPKAD